MTDTPERELIETDRELEILRAWGMHTSLWAADTIEALLSRVDKLEEALRIFVHAASPVATEIDSRGHSWCESYLEEALPIGRDALNRSAS